MVKTTGPLDWVPPRFGTPRDRDRESFGHQVGEVVRRLGKEPMPYQQHVWDVALEVDESGRFVYDEVDLTIMRQSGKTTLEFGKSTWRLTVAPTLRRSDGKLWGRQRALYTAQRRTDARKKLEQEFAVMLRESPRSFHEITNVKARPVKATDWKLSLNNGAEHILFGRGNYFAIDAPVKDAGHGDTLDDVNIDEAFAHQDDAVEQGVQPTMATRWNPQLWMLSTAGDHESPYLWAKVRAGRERSCVCGARFLDDCACGFVPSGRTAFFEWSLPDDADIDDEGLWWQFMPALGRTISPEFVRSQLEKARRNPDEGGEDLWRRAYGNQWVRTPMIGGTGRPVKIPAEAWAVTLAKFDEVPAMAPGAVPIGFDVAPGGAWASISLAAGTPAAPYGEVTDHQQSTSWLPGRVAELVTRWRPRQVGFDGQGPAAAVADAVRAAVKAAGGDPDIVKPLTSTEYKAACGTVYLDVIEGRLKRAASVALDEAVADAVERRVGDAWLWDRRTATVPICPLVSLTCARALLTEPRVPLVFAY